MKKQDGQPSRWYQEDFLASHSHHPGSEEAKKMTVTSGQRCSELYRNSGPLGSLVKMLLESSAWSSTRCFLIWKVSATPSRRLLFRLVPSMPPTGETVSPLWLGTLEASAKPRTARFAKGRTPNPAEYVKMFPTATGQSNGQACGDLNPQWAEWFMGFPIGWTDLDASETQ